MTGPVAVIVGVLLGFVLARVPSGEIRIPQPRYWRLLLRIRWVRHLCRAGVHWDTVPSGRSWCNECGQTVTARRARWFERRITAMLGLALLLVVVSSCSRTAPLAPCPTDTIRLAIGDTTHHQLTTWYRCGGAR